MKKSFLFSISAVILLCTKTSCLGFFYAGPQFANDPCQRFGTVACKARCAADCSNKCAGVAQGVCYNKCAGDYQCDPGRTPLVPLGPSATPQIPNLGPCLKKCGGDKTSVCFQNCKDELLKSMTLPSEIPAVR